MNVLICKRILFSNQKDVPDDWEDFDEIVSVYIGVEGSDSFDRIFQLRVISLAAIGRYLKEGSFIHLRYSLVLQYFDKFAIKKHVSKWIKNYQSLCSTEKSLKYLAKYFYLESDFNFEQF